MASIDDGESQCSLFVYNVSVAAIPIVGIFATVLTGVWMGNYGGFAWDGSAKEFNYHPLCMVISMVFLNSEGKIYSLRNHWFATRNDSEVMQSTPR